jgi:hypothetical protein
MIFLTWANSCPNPAKQVVDQSRTFGMERKKTLGKNFFHEAFPEKIFHKDSKYFMSGHL